MTEDRLVIVVGIGKDSGALNAYCTCPWAKAGLLSIISPLRS
jgi:hypothetical protein